MVEIPGRNLLPDTMGLGFMLYLVSWTVIAILLLWFWSDLPVYVKWPASMFEALAAPDVGAFRALFSHKKRDGDDIG